MANGSTGKKGIDGDSSFSKSCSSFWYMMKGTHHEVRWLDYTLDGILRIRIHYDMIWYNMIWAWFFIRLLISGTRVPIQN